MYYGEEFIQGDVTFGAYVCELTLTDPDGFTMQAGGPGTFVTPAARDHGGPPVAALVGAAKLGELMRGGPTVPEGRGIVINNPGSGDVRPATLVREIARGEKIADIEAEAKYRTFADGVEHAVVKTAEGKRVMVSGGSKGIELPRDTKVLYGHTHPPVK